MEQVLRTVVDQNGCGVVDALLEGSHMPTNQEIAERLNHFSTHIQQWRDEAARLTLRVAQARQLPPVEAELVELEETANAIYRDITAFQATVDEVAAHSPAAASELQTVSDALRLVLLEITELGVRLYSVHSGIPHTAAGG